MDFYSKNSIKKQMEPRIRFSIGGQVAALINLLDGITQYWGLRSNHTCMRWRHPFFLHKNKFMNNRQDKRSERFVKVFMLIVRDNNTS